MPHHTPVRGAYYPRWIVSSANHDQDGVGGRAGFSAGPISLGATYDRTLDCSKNCDGWTPIAGAGFTM